MFFDFFMTPHLSEAVKEQQQQQKQSGKRK